MRGAERGTRPGERVAEQAALLADAVAVAEALREGEDGVERGAVVVAEERRVARGDLAPQGQGLVAAAEARAGRRELRLGPELAVDLVRKVAPPEPDLDAEWRQIAASEAPVSAGFNFESDDERRFVAGIDTDPESGEQRMLSFWSSGLSVQIAFAAIALTFVFYVYVGVTGGITDGFDRFDGPGESVQQTLADPNYQPPLPPGAWTTGIQ